MNRLPLSLTAGLLALAGLAAHAQGTAAVPALQNVVQLAASATVQVQQDWLALTMSTTRDGTDASVVQHQLRQALDSALQETRRLAGPEQFDVRTGRFNLVPRYNRDGRITGWQGTVELALEGRDFAQIAAAAGKVQSLTMAGVQFSLSPRQRARAEDEARSLAIERFKAQAGEIAKGFGFTSYQLREVSINANDQGMPPRPRLMAMEARAAVADAPVPIEAGKASIVVTVSGTVQLR